MASKTKNADISGLSDEELMDQWTALGEEVQAGRDRLAEFSHEHQRRERLKQIEAALGQLSQEDKDLIQSMEPVGVESEEVVGSDA